MLFIFLAFYTLVYSNDYSVKFHVLIVLLLSQILQEEFEDVAPKEKLKRFISYVGGMVIMHFISEYSTAIHDKSIIN